LSRTALAGAALKEVFKHFVETHEEDWGALFKFAH